MVLTDPMEKPATAGRTSGSIAFFSNSYARLPEHFFARLAPTPVAKPHLIKFNDSLASELGVNTQGLDPDGLAAVFAGNVTPPGAEPIAMAYAGHQFGNFVPPAWRWKVPTRRWLDATAAQSSSARSWTATASDAMSS